MPAAKTAVKKTKKVTIDDVWATIADIGKAHKETEKALKATQEAHLAFKHNGVHGGRSQALAGNKGGC